MKKYGLGLRDSRLDGTEKNAADMLSPQANLPLSYTYDYVVDVYDQGNTMQCVCYALGLNQKWRFNISGAEGLDVSRQWLYDNREDKTLEGMEPKNALEILKNIGWVEENDYKKKNLITYPHYHKIRAYAKVGSIEVLKRALMLNGPVLLCLPVYSYEGKFWKNTTGQFLGGHAVSVIGWDEDGIIIQNSWGRSWNGDGRVHMSNADFYKYTKECWTVFV